jgi:hypothetical protein
MERGGYAVGFTACAITGVLIAGVVAVLRTDRFSRRPVPRPYLP